MNLEASHSLPKLESSKAEGRCIANFMQIDLLNFSSMRAVCFWNYLQMIRSAYTDLGLTSFVFHVRAVITYSLLL